MKGTYHSAVGMAFVCVGQQVGAGILAALVNVLAGKVQTDQ